MKIKNAPLKNRAGEKPLKQQFPTNKGATRKFLNLAKKKFISFLPDLKQYLDTSNIQFTRIYIPTTQRNIDKKIIPLLRSVSKLTNTQLNTIRILLPNSINSIRTLSVTGSEKNTQVCVILMDYLNFNLSAMRINIRSHRRRIRIRNNRRINKAPIPLGNSSTYAKEYYFKAISTLKEILDGK